MTENSWILHFLSGIANGGLWTCIQMVGMEHDSTIREIRMQRHVHGCMRERVNRMSIEKTPRIKRRNEINASEN
jgi:hypothetical protein